MRYTNSTFLSFTLVLSICSILPIGSSAQILWDGPAECAPDNIDHFLLSNRLVSRALTHASRNEMDQACHYFSRALDVDIESYELVGRCDHGELRLLDIEEGILSIVGLTEMYGCPLSVPF